MSCFKLEYEKDKALPSLTLDYKCIEDISSLKKISLNIRFGNIFYNPFFNCCYTVLIQQNDDYSFKNFTFSLLDIKDRLESESFKLTIQKEEINKIGSKIKFLKVNNVSDFIQHILNTNSNNYLNLVYIGNMIIDDISILKEKLMHAKEKNRYITAEDLEKTENRCLLSNILLSENKEKINYLFDIFNKEYQDLLNLKLWCSDNKRKYFLSEILKLRNDLKIPMSVDEKTYHLYLDKKILSFEERIKNEYKVVFKIKGIMDSILLYKNERLGITEKFMLCFNKEGLPSIFSFKTNKFYDIPTSDIDIRSKEIVYPYNLKLENWMSPDLENIDFIYYYTEKINAS